MLVCTAAFMLLLDITIVSVALPSIQRDLRASLPDLQWVSAAYALVLAVLLLPAATLGDRLGQARLFLARLVIFTAGSLACALAPTALALQLFRALQEPAAHAVRHRHAAVARGVLRRRPGPALGVFGATIGGASAVWPLAGGVLTTRWAGGPSSSSICPSAWRCSRAGWPGCANPATRPAAGRLGGHGLVTGALTALMFALTAATRWAGQARRSWPCSRPPPWPLPGS